MCLSCIRLRNSWQSLAKHTSRATGVPAPETTDRGNQLHGRSLPRQVLQAPVIAAVERTRDLAAHGTGRRLIHHHKQLKLVIRPFHTFQNQNPGVWQDGLRMAGGRRHCPNSLKHFCLGLSFRLRVAPKVRKSPELAPFGILFWPPFVKHKTDTLFRALQEPGSEEPVGLEGQSGTV